MNNLSVAFRAFFVCALLFALNSFAHAEGIPLGVFFAMKEGASLLKVPATQKSLLKLAEHLEIDGAAKVATHRELIDLIQARLERPQYQTERRMIEERLSNVRDSYKSHSSWLDQAASELEINPQWRASESSAESLFAKPPRSKSFRASTESFLSEPKLRHPPEAEVVAATKSFQASISEMRSCLGKKPAEELKKIKARYLFNQLWMDELMTAGGVLLSAGSLKSVEWQTIGADLAFEGLASIADSLIATMPKMPGKRKVDIRWYVMQLVGVGQSSVDALIYSISLPEEERKISTKSRFLYNTGWNAAYGKFSIEVYDLIAGMECLEAPRALRIGAMLGAGLGSNFVYFESRARILGKNSD